MKTAKFIKVLPNFSGTAHLFRMKPPLEGHEYVVGSAVVAPYTGPETYLFPSDETGKVTDWGELDASQRGTLDIEGVLGAAGYEVEA